MPRSTTTPKEPIRLQTLRGVARRAGCSTRTVHDAVAAGRIRPDFTTDAGGVLFRERRLPRLVRALGRAPISTT